MLQKYKKQVIYVSLIVLFLIVVICIFLHLKSQNQVTKEQQLSTSYKDSKTVTIKSVLPISDELGRTIDGKGTEDGIQGYVELTITNNIDKKIDYDIYIEARVLDHEIKGNYIKFYLTDEADNPLDWYKQNTVPTYADLLSLTDKPGARVLHSGRLKEKESKKIIVRVWLADSYAVSNEIDSFSFDISTRAK